MRFCFSLTLLFVSLFVQTLVGSSKNGERKGDPLAQLCSHETKGSKPDVSVTAFSEPSTFVNNVNTIFGNFLLSTVDFTVPGPTPLHMIRYYNSSLKKISFLNGLGMTMNIPIWIRGVQAPDYDYMMYWDHRHDKKTEPLQEKAPHFDEAEKMCSFIFDEEGGSVVGCIGQYDTDKFNCYITPETIHKGLTNASGGEISGRTNLKNMKLTVIDHRRQGALELIVTLPNGGERQYYKIYNFADVRNIREEKKPNGNRLFFDYNRNGTFGAYLKEIKATNHRTTHTHGWLALERNGWKHEVVATASNGKWAVYSYERRDKEPCKDVPFVTKVSSSDQPDTYYDYSTIEDERLLTKISKPQGRYLKIYYDKKGRVIEQKGPVGPDNKEATMCSFKYEPSEFSTKVYDANDNKSEYHYSSKKRLKSINRYDSSNHLLRRDSFIWGDKEHLSLGERDDSDEGNLISKAIEGPEGILTSVRYSYDDYGNITDEKLYGNLSGGEKNTFHLEDDGKPKDKSVESYKKSFSYSHDRFHVCTEQTEDSGPTVELVYKEDTDLLAAKYTKEGSYIKIREFFEYDDAAVLVRKIIDDGSSHDQGNLKNVTEQRITYINPVRDKTDYGVGQPAEVMECYLNNGEVKMLSRKAYSYTRAGRVYRETVFDANNQERYHTFYEYNNKGHLTKLYHSAGKETLYEYDENGNKTREEILSSGFYTEYVYDAADRLIREVAHHKDGPTLTTTYTYDNAGNKIKETDHFGQVTKYEYDALGRVTAVFYPKMCDKDGSKIYPQERTSYDALNNPTSVTDENGNVTTTEYTARGQPCLVRYPDGSKERTFYNLNGTIAKKIDRHGVETIFEYDFLGRVVKEVVAGTKVTTHTYSSFHKTSSTDPLGNTIYYNYDKAGRLVEEWENGHKTTYEYDSLGRKEREKEYTSDGSFLESIEIHDFFDRVVEEKEVYSDGTLLSLKKYTYDVLDNRTEEKTYFSENAFYTDRTCFNSQSLPIQHTDALNNTTHFYYDYEWQNSLSQKVLKKTTVDPLGNSTIEIFDAYNRVVSVEHRSPKKLLARVEYAYDAKGNKTLEKEFVYSDETLLREYRIEWTYSSTDLVLTCTEQPGTDLEKKTSYSYKKGGLVDTITTPNGTQIHHSYDTFSRLSSMNASDSTVSYVYSYDLNDNVLSVQDEVLGITHTKTYDNHDRVVRDVIGTGIDQQFSYDALDRVTNFSLGSGESVDYRYSSGRLRNVVRKNWSNELYTHRYETFDLDGNVTRSSLPSSCGTVQNTWDALGRLTQVFSEHFEENCAEFDGVGNLLKITEKDPLGSKTYSFVYDDLYQLLEEKSTIDARYKNDSLCNRLKMNDDQYSVNPLNQLVSTTEISYTYDRDGNPTEIKKGNETLKLFYDALDRLIAVEKPLELRVEYAYDASHRRIFKKTFQWNDSWVEEDLQKFIYFDRREVGSVDKNGVVKEFRVLGLGKGAELGASVAIEIGTQTFCPIHDHRGNIAVLIDMSTKQPTDTYRYSAFGEEELSGSASPWRFASKRVDPETGFVFFGRRYYSPQAGRFLTPDPVGFSDGPNLYSYVHNSPLILIDPYGLMTGVADPVEHARGAYEGFSDPFGVVNKYVGYASKAAEMARNKDYSPIVERWKSSSWRDIYKGYSRFEGHVDGLCAFVGSFFIPVGVSARAVTMAPKVAELAQATRTISYAKTGATALWKSSLTQEGSAAIFTGSNIVSVAMRSIKLSPIAKTSSFVIRGSRFPQYVPKDLSTGNPLPLPRDKNGVPIPSTNSPHSQIGWRNGSKEGYRQTREWENASRPIKTTDWTKHGNRLGHTYPHDHRHLPNSTGGSLKRDDPIPFSINNSIGN